MTVITVLQKSKLKDLEIKQNCISKKKKKRKGCERRKRKQRLETQLWMDFFFFHLFETRVHFCYSPLVFHGSWSFICCWYSRLACTWLTTGISCQMAHGLPPIFHHSWSMGFQGFFCFFLILSSVLDGFMNSSYLCDMLINH